MKEDVNHFFDEDYHVRKAFLMMAVGESRDPRFLQNNSSLEERY